jgi:hypothetical protein
LARYFILRLTPVGELRVPPGLHGTGRHRAARQRGHDVLCELGKRVTVGLPGPEYFEQSLARSPVLLQRAQCLRCPSNGTPIFRI